jgi:hypothetical protein
MPMKKPLILGCLVCTLIFTSCSKVETNYEKTSATENVVKINTNDTIKDADFVIEVNEEGKLYVRNVVN